MSEAPANWLAGRSADDYCALVISIETTDESVRVTIPKDDVSPERLNSFLDWLRMEAVTRRSTLTEQEAHKIAEETKKSWWTANKDRFLRPDDQ